MNMLNDILCVILARGGSKGIPGKNLKLLGGIPLIAHSILHAKQCLPFGSMVVVSSDDDDILKCADKYGAFPLLRPEEFATDEASSECALIHAVEKFDIPDILFLQPTSPIRFKDTIPKFIDYYRRCKFDSCLTTTKIPKFFWVPQPLGPAVANYDIFNRPRKQDMSRSYFRYFDNGSAYLVRREALLRERCRFGDGKNVGVFPISDLEAMQIDTPEEFAVIEAIFKGKVSQWTGVNQA